MIGAVRHVSRHFAVYACLAFAVAAIERVAEAILTDGPYYESRDRMLTQFFVNYADHGFAKRAVIGTLLKPVTGRLDAPEHFAFGLMVAVSLAALGGAIVLTQRYLPHREDADAVAILRCALAVGSLGVMQIAHDLGRFDWINLALLAVSVTAVARGRPWLAAGICALAILIHEAFAVYGAPLVVALGWQAARQGRGAALARVLPVILAATVAGLAVLLFGNSEAAVGIGRGSGGYVWERGLFEFAGHLGPREVVLLTLYWGALAAFYFGLTGGRPGLLLLAAVSPLALNLLGIDHARWLALAFYAMLFNLAARWHALGRPLSAPSPAARRAGYLLCLPLGPIGVVEPLAWWP